MYLQEWSFLNKHHYSDGEEWGIGLVTLIQAQVYSLDTQGEGVSAWSCLLSMARWQKILATYIAAKAAILATYWVSHVPSHSKAASQENFLGALWAPKIES